MRQSILGAVGRGRLGASRLAGNRYYSGPKSDHFDGKRFFNPGGEARRRIGQVLKWHLTSDWQPWPERVTVDFTDLPPARIDNGEIRASFVGHNSFLIQYCGLNIVTDPVWSRRASPSRRFGPTRVHAPGIAMSALPRIDAVLISHNHYDHLDLPTLAHLWRRDRPRIITPLGNDKVIQKRLPEVEVEAYDWGDGAQVSPEVRVHLVQAHHWSARGLFDRSMALWGSFVVESQDGALYLSGDTAYAGGRHFCEARERYGPFQLAVLPIGAYEPRWFMSGVHMNPEEAVRAHLDLGAPPTLASHFGTFQLTEEARGAPLEALHAARVKHRVEPATFRALQPGEAWWLAAA